MLTIAVGVLWFSLCLLHIASIALVTTRIRRAKRARLQDGGAEFVSLVRTVSGLENDLEACLRSSFTLQYSHYEIIFCVHDANDPVVPLINRLMTDHQKPDARLLVGNAQLNGNPKLNNMAKSWDELRSEWVVFSDGNVVLEPLYLQKLFAAWRPSTGAVSSVHIGSRPESFWADVECAFLNPYQARWHMTFAALGLGFVHGKTMMLRRSFLNSAGGMDALATEIAEDVALTKLVRSRGMTIDASFAPTAQPLGNRSKAEVLARQARWARLRREGYPLGFALEPVPTGAVSIVAAALFAGQLGLSAGWAVFGQIAFWYGLEIVFLRMVGWHCSWSTLPALILRDLLIPPLWLYGWFGRSFRWGTKPVYEQ